MAEIRGKTSGTHNRLEIRFSPTEADQIARTVEGPKEAILPLIQELKNAGFSGTYVSDKSPLAAITYFKVGSAQPDLQPDVPETPTLVWEYLAAEFEIDLLESDIAAINSVSAEEKRLIRDAIQNPTPGQSPAVSSPGAIDVYQLMLGGVRSHRVSIPTLRVSKVVSSAYPIKASIANVGRVITTTTLQNQENIPASILFNLPSSSNVTKNDQLFTYGWRKKHPVVNQVGGGRFNVTQEWEWGLWSVRLNQVAL